MSDLDMNFSESIYDIESAVRKFGFPVVIKSENACSGKGRHDTDEYYDDSQRLPFGSITMLERKITLQFAHVTVMDFRDPEKVQDEKGIEFIESHSEYEDEDYLLPLKYGGKCKIVHPPGKRKRYVDVVQLIKDLPRFIQIINQLVSVDTESDDVKIISAGEVLEIVNVKMINTDRYLICKDKTEKCVMISEEIPVNITAIDDTNDYTLEELTNTVYLPKCIEYEDVSPYEIVIYDDFWANHLLVMAGGPFRVNSVVEKEVILGWCIPVESDGSVRPFRTVLIPKNKWKKQKVKVRSFHKDTERVQYTKKHFPGYNDSEYVNNKLYLMDAENYPGIVWLQNRQPISEQAEWNFRRDSREPKAFRPPPLPVKREELPDSDLELDYEEPIPKPDPAPPIPPRTVKLPTRAEKPDYWKEVIEKIQTKAKSGFDKVHLELHNLFRHKSEDQPPPLYPRPTEITNPKQRYDSEGCQTQRPTEIPQIRRQSEDTKQQKASPKPKLKQSYSVDEPLKHSNRKEVKRSQSSVTTKTKASQDLYLTPPDKAEINSIAAIQLQCSQEDTFLKRPQLPLPDLPEKGQTKAGTCTPDYEQDHEYDYPDVRDLAKKGYVGIDVAEADRVSRAGQNAEDFYDYSIVEVVQCFKMVALPDIAEICEKEKFDGAFFKQFAEKDIKTYFKLDTLHLIKVRKTIFDGWRPR